MPSSTPDPPNSGKGRCCDVTGVAHTRRPRASRTSEHAPRERLRDKPHVSCPADPSLIPGLSVPHIPTRDLVRSIKSSCYLERGSLSQHLKKLEQV